MTRDEIEREIAAVETDRQTVLNAVADAIHAAEYIDRGYPAPTYVADIINDAYFEPLQRLDEAREETLREREKTK